MVALLKGKAQMCRAGHRHSDPGLCHHLANKEDKALSTEVTEGTKTVVWMKCSNVQGRKRKLHGPGSLDADRQHCCHRRVVVSVQALTTELKKKKGDTCSLFYHPGLPTHLPSVIPATCSSHVSSASQSVPVVEMGLGYPPPWGRKAKGAWWVGVLWEIQSNVASKSE